MKILCYKDKNNLIFTKSVIKELDYTTKTGINYKFDSDAGLDFEKYDGYDSHISQVNIEREMSKNMELNYLSLYGDGDFFKIILDIKKIKSHLREKDIKTLPFWDRMVSTRRQYGIELNSYIDIDIESDIEQVDKFNVGLTKNRFTINL